MFYIHRRRPERARDVALTHVVPTILIFAAFFGLTIWSANEALRTIDDSAASIVERETERAELAIQNRLRAYEGILRAGVGATNISGTVNRQQWGVFVGALQLEEQYPGVQAIGLVDIVPHQTLETYVAERERNNPERSFTVFPATDNEVHALVRYVEPNNARTRDIVGYDMYAEPVRRTAMETARDGATVATSDAVRLIREQTDGDTMGFLMYAPIYETAAAPVERSQRRADVRGYIYAVFRADEFFEEVFANSSDTYSFRVYDGSVSDKTLLYERPSYDAISRMWRGAPSTHQFSAGNQRWVIASVIDPAAVSALERSRPSAILWGGTFLSLTIAGFIYLLLMNRTRALQHREDRNLRRAKDELLALASHQLRTPATGVKQYIGLLRDGYAGDLSDEQKRYVDKAYASNERQLSTINEILFVARADAGDIALSVSEFDVAALLREVIEEQASLLAEKRLQLRTHIAHRATRIRGDERYIRMVCENLINNAIKYTHEGGMITVALKTGHDSVRISIKDTGVGVSEADQALLFQKFSRIPNELTNKVTGSGVGLYIARKIVVAHKGDIEFSSREAVGSTFTITLPTNPETERTM